MHLNCDEGEAFRSHSQWSLPGALVQTSLRDLGTGVSHVSGVHCETPKDRFPLGDERRGGSSTQSKLSSVLSDHIGTHDSNSSFNVIQSSNDRVCHDTVTRSPNLVRDKHLMPRGCTLSASL